MKKILSFLIPAVLLFMLIGGIAFKLKKNKTTAEERIYHQPSAESEILADTTSLLISTTDTTELSFSGVFEPFRETKISAETPGKINHITVDAGSVVRKGQVLVQLDDALLQLQLQSVEVQIEGFTADVHRYAVLAKADAVQGIQLEKAQLSLKAALVQRATIVEQVNKTTIKAPFDGVVLTKLNEVGGFAAPGTPLLHLLEIDQLRFIINVSERDLQYFRLGQSCEIIADAFPEKKITGKVSMIASKASIANTFPVQFTVSNASGQALRGGMFGKITLTNKSKQL